MMTPNSLCEAIASHRLVSFNSGGHVRVVEPHMVARNEAGHYALSGWSVGYSKSGGQGWREYLINEMSNLTVLSETFANARPGYKPRPSKKFPHVFCKL